MPGLSASGLTCIKRDRVLFEALTFSVESGQLIYLRGPNGAGKTSLLRILTGLSDPIAGDVLYDGQPILSSSSTYLKQLVYLGHKPGLNMGLNALENLRYWCAQHGVEQTDEQIYLVLEHLGLVGMEGIPVRFLSAGQQRRVALSRLWLKPAAVWILDEPFTALDVQGVSLLERKFKAHAENGGMIVTTSHQPLSEEAGALRTMDLEYRF